MPSFPYHLAAERDDPYPPVAELRTIEANDPLDALERLKHKLILGEPGVESAWLRVVVSQHACGSVRHVVTQQVPLTPVAPNN